MNFKLDTKFMIPILLQISGCISTQPPQCIHRIRSFPPRFELEQLIEVTSQQTEKKMNLISMISMTNTELKASISDALFQQPQLNFTVKDHTVVITYISKALNSYKNNIENFAQTLNSYFKNETMDCDSSHVNFGGLNFLSIEWKEHSLGCSFPQRIKTNFSKSPTWTSVATSKEFKCLQ